jgi:transposase
MEDQHFIGIDVSKGYADFTILNKEKHIVEENFQLDDTFEGHQKLYAFLKKYFARNSKLTLYCAVESTGGYENNWFSSLHQYQSEMNLFVTRLNPLGVHHSSKAALNRITTDKESAKNIAEYLISYPEKVDYQREPFLSTAKRVWTFI